MEDKNFLRTIQLGEATGYSQEVKALRINCILHRITCIGKSITKTGHQLLSRNIIILLIPLQSFQSRNEFKLIRSCLGFASFAMLCGWLKKSRYLPSH